MGEIALTSTELLCDPLDERALMFIEISSFICKGWPYSWEPRSFLDFLSSVYILNLNLNLYFKYFRNEINLNFSIKMQELPDKNS